MIDGLTNAVRMITWEHHEIHDGDMHTIAVFDGTLALNETLNMAFKTGSKSPHLFLEWGVNGSAHIEILEGGGWTTNTGTLVTIQNKNRENGEDSEILEDKTATPVFTATGKVLENVTALTGTVIWYDYAFGAKNNPSRSRDENEIVLAKNTNYGIRITSDTNGNSGYFRITWYEHG